MVVLLVKKRGFYLYVNNLITFDKQFVYLN